MTENTQTTQERLLAIIGMNYATIQHGDIRIADHSKAAGIIAAEIDGYEAGMRFQFDRAEDYKAQRDGYANQGWQKNLENIALTAQLAEARAEIERLRPKAHAWDTHRHAMFLTGEQDAALLKHEFECEDAFITSWEAEAKERGISPYEISGYTDMQMDQHQRILEGYYTAMEAASARAAKESRP